MLSNFYQPHILQPTHFADHCKLSLIDNIFINSIEFGTISGNFIPKISDHMPNFLILEKIDLRTSIIMYRSDQCDITGTKNGVNATMEKFQLKLIKVIDYHAPLLLRKTETEKETMD